METTSIRAKATKEIRTFFEQISKSNERIFLILFSLYISTFYMIRILWIAALEDFVTYTRVGMLSVIMWGSAIYLFFIIAEWKKLWKKTVPLLLLGVCLLGITGWFSNRMSTNAYNAVMDVFFCLMVCGKNYKKIIRCVMWVAVGTLVVAAVGMLMHFTLDAMKPDNVSPGHSFGIIYPNTWGYIAFVAMMTCWYLHLRLKPVVTFALFWSVAAFMFFVISCRTISLLTIIFPVMAVIVDWLERKKMEKEKELTEIKRISILRYAAIAIPFTFLVLTLVLCWKYEWVHRLYRTPLKTMAMRFVQGALFLKTYGAKLLGNTFRSNELQYVLVNSEYIQLDILDNSFISYLVSRGILWVACCLGWQSIAIRKALKMRDFAIPFLCGSLLAYATMERPGLDVWVNFILLYPLAKVAGKPGTEPEPVAEPAVPGKAEPEIGLPNDLPLPADSAAEE